ncbi:MAG: hypothetical protein Tsb0016_08600 [Sphingomonadales bacterium]
MAGAADPAWAWSQLWRTGAAQSCPALLRTDSEDGTALLARWRAFFAGLPAAGRVLDLGTGNGVIARQAVLASRQQGLDLEVHGADLAATDPRQVAQDSDQVLAAIQFHPGVAIEALPFPDHWCDGLSSQFALEYADLDAAAAQAMRVLKPGGRFCLLLHAADSALSQHCRDQHRQAVTLLESPLLDRLSTALGAIHHAQHTDTPASLEAAQTAIAALKAAMDAQAAQALQAGDNRLSRDFLAAVGRLPAQAVAADPAWLQTQIQDLRQRLTAQAQRLAAQAAAGLDRDATQALAARLAAAGAVDIAIEACAIGSPPQLIGRWMHGRRGGA